MRVAPTIGSAVGVRNAYAVQWLAKIRAFSLEIAQSWFFVLIAIVLIAIGQFGLDLARLGVPGI